MSHFFLNHLDTMSNSITRENHAKIVLQAKVHLWAKMKLNREDNLFCFNSI